MDNFDENLAKKLLNDYLIKLYVARNIKEY
jgi:hypothetical protein